MSEKKRTRKKNFTSNETDRLIDLVEENYKIISSKFSDQITLQRKNDVWKDISRKINAISPCLRTVDEIRKKWDDIKVRSKKKANEDRAKDGKTGNTPRSPTTSDSLTGTERRVVGMLGVSQVFGICEGDENDTMDTAPSTSKKKDQKVKNGRISLYLSMKQMITGLTCPSAHNTLSTYRHLGLLS